MMTFSACLLLRITVKMKVEVNGVRMRTANSDAEHKEIDNSATLLSHGMLGGVKK